MATKATPVTEAEYDADQKLEAEERTVRKTSTHVPGVGELDIYVKVEHVDDVDGKTSEGVQTVKFAVPELVEPEDQDEESFYRTVTKEIDLGPANLAKLIKALDPFTKAARDASATAVARPVSGGTGANPAVTAWNRRAKEWLRNAGHDVKEKGRLAENLAAIYSKNHPQDPRPS